MARMTGRMKELSAEGCALWDQLEAILQEHIPAELLTQVRLLITELQNNGFSQSFLELAQLYRALLALMPENQPQIRAAYQATVFEHDRNDQKDWETFEKEGLSC